MFIFQNSNHIDVKDIIKKWNIPNMFSGKVKITYINSLIDMIFREISKAINISCNP